MSVSNTLHTFKKGYWNVEVTFEKKEYDRRASMDICLCRRLVGSASLSVHRKAAWAGQCIHFNSFVQFRIRRNLIGCVINRARKISVEVTIGTGLLFLQDVSALWLSWTFHWKNVGTVGRTTWESNCRKESSVHQFALLGWHPNGLHPP